MKSIKQVFMIALTAGLLSGCSTVKSFLDREPKEEKSLPANMTKPLDCSAVEKMDPRTIKLKDPHIKQMITLCQQSYKKQKAAEKTKGQQK